MVSNPAFRISIALSIVSGMIMSVPFSFPKAWICGWFGLLPYFYAVQGHTKGRTLLLSFFTGLAFWVCTIYWLVHVTLPGTVILIGYLSLYFVVFGFFVWHTLDRFRWQSVFFLSAAWTALEFIRAYLFTGFGWAQVGYGQYLNLPFIQVADFAGVWGVSFMVIGINLVVWKLFAPGIPPASKRIAAVALLIVLSAVGAYGLSSIRAFQRAKPDGSLRVAVVQGNIPQEMKWDSRAIGAILKEYVTLSMQAAGEKPGIIIWPEAALPFIAEQEPDYYQVVLDSIRRMNIPVLMGMVTEREGNFYNSAYLIDHTGVATQHYDKVHLVPFGEYIPLKKLLPFLQTVVPIGDTTAGSQYTVFTNIRKHFSALICFEDLFPELSRAFVKRGARWLVTITNDAWYKDTSEQAQHLACSVFRAVENRVPVARSANTGISCFIGPTGKILSVVKNEKGKVTFVRGFLTHTVMFTKKRGSIYSRHGNIFVGICGCVMAYGVVFGIWLRRPRIGRRNVVTEEGSNG